MKLVSIIPIARRLARDSSGVTLVELAIVLPIFLLLIFGLLDFGRLAYDYVWMEKAAQIATRIAIVRPPVCANVPNTFTAGTANAAFGTNCRSGSNICAVPPAENCDGSGTNVDTTNGGNNTLNEIWSKISGLLPFTATQANLHFSYVYDPNNNLGFLGGPYEPMVTVSIEGVSFVSMSVLGGLAKMATGGNNSTLGNNLIFPSISVTMPGEDLAQGEAG